MRLLDRYIFREWLKAFLLALAVTLGVLLVEDIQDDLPDFLDWGASTATILGYYAIYIPSFLPTLIPAALLVSLLFTLGNLHRNNEIMAMRASGLKLLRITRSLWLAAFVLAGVLFYLNATIVPQSLEQSRKTRENLQFAHQAETSAEDRVGVLMNLTYDNRKDNRRWFVNRFSRYFARGYGISVYELDEQGRMQTRWLAKEGIYDDTVNYWIFENGRETRFDPETNEPYFDKFFELREMPNFTENHQLMQTLSTDGKDLSIYEVTAALDQVSPEDNPRMVRFEVRLHEILASPFICLVVAGIAIPFAVSGVRTNPIVGVAKAGGLFVLYFALSRLFYMLGEQAVLQPWQAVWIPNILMLAVAIYFIRKAR